MTLTNRLRRVLDFSGIDYQAPDAAERARQDHEAYLDWLADRATQAIERADEQDDGVVVESGTRRVLDFTEVADLSGETDGRTLMRLDLPPLHVLLPDLLIQGTTILAAPPKIGKSMWCYQLAVETALLGTFLGRQVLGGQVLYMALEDGKLRGQKRLGAALAGRDLPADRLTIRWESPVIGSGLETLIEEWLSRHPYAALVIIDTLAKVRPYNNGKRNAYDVDVEDLGALQNMMRDKSVCLLVVHHTKKALTDDFVAQVSGTYGVAGSADTILLLRRKRMEKLAMLDVTSRELPEIELALKFEDMHWTDAPGSLPGATTERQAIYSVIEDEGPIMPAAVARILRLERTSVQHLVSKLVADGLVMRAIGGYVAIARMSAGVNGGADRSLMRSLPESDRGVNDESVQSEQGDDPVHPIH